MTHMKTNIPTKKSNKVCIQEFFQGSQGGSSPDFSSGLVSEYSGSPPYERTLS